MYSSLDHTYRDDIGCCDAERRLTTVHSIVQGLHQRLMTLLDNHHTSSLTHRPCCKRPNQCRKPLNAQFSLRDNETTIQLYGNACSGRLQEVAIRTHPHPGKRCIISWWIMLSPPCGPSAMNHMNCLPLALKRHHRNCYCVVANVFSIIETTEILIVIDIVCNVGKSLETPTDVNL